MGKRKRRKAEAEVEIKAKKKRRRGFRKIVFLLVIGGVASLALSESVRNKALDALFGSEEEFQYTPPTSPVSDAPSDSPKPI
jgi:hypothetical protein